MGHIDAVAMALFASFSSHRNIGAGSPTDALPILPKDKNIIRNFITELKKGLNFVEVCDTNLVTASNSTCFVEVFENYKFSFINLQIIKWLL